LIDFEICAQEQGREQEVSSNEMCIHSKFASKVYESIDVEVLEALHFSRNKHRFRASGSKLAKEEQKSWKVRDYVF